jgi:hypothetical protein
MNDVGRLRHSVWECKYHLVWIPKCRRKVLYGQLRRELVEVFHELARRKECRIEEGHLEYFKAPGTRSRRGRTAALGCLATRVEVISAGRNGLGADEAPADGTGWVCAGVWRSFEGGVVKPRAQPSPDGAGPRWQG